MGVHHRGRIPRENFHLWREICLKTFSLSGGFGVKTSVKTTVRTTVKTAVKTLLKTHPEYVVKTGADFA